MSFVPEIRHVQEPSATSGGVEDLFLEHRVAIVEQAVDEYDCLESHNPVPCLAETLGDGGDAGVDVSTRVGGEIEDGANVLLVGRVFVVARSLDNGYLKVRCHVA